METEGLTPRGEILETARKLTEGDRNQAYGDPHWNLTTYAQLCNAYLEALPKDRVLDSVDASILMVLAKVSRVAVNKHHRDNYTDMAAYAAIAGECARKFVPLAFQPLELDAPQQPQQ